MPFDQAAGRDEPAVVGTVDVVAATLALRRVGALRAERQSRAGIRTSGAAVIGLGGALALIAEAGSATLFIGLTVPLVATAVVLAVVVKSVVVTEDRDEVTVLNALTRL